MASIYRDQLLKNEDFKKCVRLVLYHLLDDLIQLSIITFNDYITINPEYNPEQHSVYVEKLLELFYIKPPQQFDKFFHLVSEKIGQSDYLDTVKRDFLNEAFVRGGLPKLSKNHIERKSRVEQVRSCLEKLEPDNYLIIHGMIGYGKSNLLVEALRDSTLVYSKFENKLFWIKLGEHSDTQNILQSMWRLYSLAIARTNRTPLTHCPEDVDELKYVLQDLFLDDDLKRSLVVLDDVANGKIIEQFDIRCKIVVTAQEKIYLSNADYIHVNGGFEEEESLKVFCKYLGVDELPYRVIAASIHHNAQGHPFLINLIGFYLQSNREMALNSNRIWDGVKKNLKSKKYDGLSVNGTLELFREIEFCTKNLDAELLKYYEYLAIFPEGVNIMPKVLEVLWDLDECQVRGKMTDLCNKSLVISFYHEDMESYIYGIHDLHLNYLKKKTTAEGKLMNFHKELISKYDKLTGNNLAKLPNDNYIIQYIAYHLQQASLTDRFTIFFDLKFLESKIKHVGVADLLSDFEIYKKEITRNGSDNLQQLDEYKRFIQLNGSDIYYHANTDIIQYALDEKQGSVFDAAMEFAENNPQRLYFNLMNESEKINYSEILNVKEEIVYACFYKNTDNILVANVDNNIKHYYNNKLIHVYSGHTGRIIDIQYSLHLDKFLSVSEDDKTARIWDLTYPKEGFISYSPRLKQDNFKNFHEEQQKCVILTLTDQDDHIVSAAFSNTLQSNYDVVAGSHRGCIKLFSDGVEKRTTTAKGSPAKCVRFTYNDECILCVESDSVFVYKTSDMDVTPINFVSHVKSLILIPRCKEFFTITEKSVWKCSWSPSPSKHEVIQEASEINCAVVTSDLQYLVFCHSNNKISLRNIELQNKKEEELPFSGRQALTLDTSNNNQTTDNILLIGSDNKTLEQIQIHAREKAREKSKNVSILSCCWSKTQPFIASVYNKNCIEIQSGSVSFVQDTQCKEDEITSIEFSACCDAVFYGTNTGNVYKYAYKTKTHSLISTSLNFAVTNIRYFKHNNEDNVLAIDGEFAMNINLTAPEKSSKQNLTAKPVAINYMFEKLLILDSTGVCYFYNLEEKKWSCVQDFAGPVLQAAFCTGSNYLGVIYNERFKIFQLLNTVQFSTKEKYCEKINNLMCCKFSFDGKYVAYGSRDGQVCIMKVAEKDKRTFKLFETGVRNLVFPTNSLPVMFCAGDQIACVDFSKLWSNCKNTVNNLSIYGTKKGAAETPYLLSCMKLHGHSIKHISASPDFTSLVAADNDGKIYYLQIKK